MKLTLFVIIFALFISACALPAMAVTTGLGATGSGEKNQGKSEPKQEQLSANLKDRAGKEIDRRIKALDKLISRLNEVKRLTADQKTTFTTQIQTEIDSLNALKTKITADTDAATLKTDAQSIVKNYRIFALYIPKISLLTASDAVMETIDKLNTVAQKLQALITKAQSQGIDTKAAQTAYNDMQTKLTDAKTQIQKVESAVMALTPEGYPGNKSLMEANRKILQLAHQDLVQARQDTKIILKFLREAKPQATRAGELKASPVSTSSGNQPG